MKYSLRFRRLLLLPVLLLFAGSLSADTVELKTGEVIDCKILNEDATSVTIEFILVKGSTIKDTKTIPKSDVKSITKLTPAQIEFKEKGLGSILPTPDLLTASDYERLIQDRLRTFTARFPGTQEAKDVEEIIKVLVEEKTKVLAGEVKATPIAEDLKLDPNRKGWLDAPTAQREKYNIDAYRLRLAMKSRLTELPEDPFLMKEAKALREFEDMRTRFPVSMQYVQTIPEALKIMEDYDKRLAAMAGEQSYHQKTREDNLKALTGPDKQRAEAAIAEEVGKFKAEAEAQNKAKMKWRSVYKYDLTSINNARTAITKERAELTNINLNAFQSEIKSLSEAIAHINAGKAEEAEALMAPLRPTKNNLVNKKTFDEYDKKLKELLARVAAEKKAAKAAAGNTAPTTGKDTPGESTNPYADALTKGKDDKGKDEKGKDDKGKDTKKTTAKTTPSTKTSTGTPSTSGTTSAPAEEEESTLQKINKYIPFIGGGLLVILIIAMVMGKKKKDEDD